jgi:hypothetical protein
MEKYIYLPLTTLLSAFVGSYLAGYLKKKGESLATHEDFQAVLAELQETTRATKQIEAKISDEMWDRQKRWELRKEIFLEMLRAVGNADVALDHTAGDLIGSGIHKLEHIAQTTQGMEECLVCSRTLGNVRSYLGVVGGSAVVKAFEIVIKSYSDAILRLDWNVYGPKDLLAEVYKFRVASDELQRAVRAELEIPMPQSLSSESSATPTPAEMK